MLMFSFLVIARNSGGNQRGGTKQSPDAISASISPVIARNSKAKGVG